MEPHPALRATLPETGEGFEGGATFTLPWRGRVGERSEPGWGDNAFHGTAPPRACGATLPWRGRAKRLPGGVPFAIRHSPFAFYPIPPFAFYPIPPFAIGKKIAMPTIDPVLFRPDAVSAETRAMNDEVARRIAASPDIWAYPPETLREARRAGRGPFPLGPKSPRARMASVAGPDGAIPVRILTPADPRGVYLHIHGGGWMLGEASFHDGVFERFAERCGLATVSVDYRLAPEHPFPAAPEDCMAVALWLVERAAAEFGTRALLVGGESAGANLAVLTLLRLRERGLLAPFLGANLIAGCYDLGLTPSARRWGERGLILDTRDIRQFVRAYLAHGEDPRDVSISPLYADLSGLPPALFSAGTQEALLDDSLFMAARWEAAGSAATLKVWPGGVHVFESFDFPMAREAQEAEIAFLNAILDQTRAE
jgi:acetyl esterase